MMLTVLHWDQTRSNIKHTYNAGSTSLNGGYYNLRFSTARLGGFADCSFEIESASPFDARRVVMFDAIEVWGLGQKVWQGRVKAPIKKAGEGRYLVECEGVGIGWARTHLATAQFTAGSPTANNYASQIYTYFVQNYRCNLLNSDVSYIGATTYAISDRTWHETSFEQCFNEINDFHGNEWFVYEGKNSSSLSDGGNRFHYQDSDAYYTDVWVVDYADLIQPVEIYADGEDYANAVRVRHGAALANYTDTQDTASQSKYTPGKTAYIGFSINSGSSTATAGDANQVGSAWITRRTVNGTVEPWAKGEITLTGKNLRGPQGTVPPYMLRANYLLRIQGLIENEPQLSDSVDNNTVFEVAATEYGHSTGQMRVALNDFTDTLPAQIARLEAS